MSNIFSKEFKKLRKAYGLSQEEIAESLGITSQAVSKWECAQSYPDIELLPQISNIFNVSLDRLILGDTKEKEYRFPFPDDSLTRVLIYKGHHLIEHDLIETETTINLPEIVNASDIEIFGNCAVAGDISCDTITVHGNIASYDITGETRCIGKISCENINGDVSVENGNINCKHITGDVFAEGNITCDSFYGEINDRS